MRSPSPGGAARDRRTSRSLGLPAGAVLSAVVVGLLLAPAAAASGPIVLTAPYAHVVVVNYNSLANGGCASVTGHRAHWNETTGTGHFSDRAFAKRCATTIPGFGTGSYAYGDSETELAIPIKTFQGGARASSVEVTWNLTLTAAQGSNVGGPCPGVTVNPVTGNGSEICDWGSEEIAGAGAYLYDQTNGSVVPSGATWAGLIVWAYNDSDTYCTTFSCTTYNGSGSSGANLSGSFSVSFWMNGTLSHFHRYQVITWVDGLAYDWVDGYARGGITSIFDMATSGNHDAVVGVTVR